MLNAGVILEEGGWADVWGVAVILYLIGTGVWLTFSTVSNMNYEYDAQPWFVLVIVFQLL